MNSQCRAHEELFSDYFDGELGAAERKNFEQHQAACATCKSEYAKFRASAEKLGDWISQRKVASPVMAMPRRETFKSQLVAAGIMLALAAGLFAMVTPGVRPVNQKLAADDKPVDSSKDADNGDDIALRAAMEKLLTAFTSEDFDTRSQAQEKLLAFVVERGQPAFDLLDGSLYDEVKKNGDAEMLKTVDAVLHRLCSPQVKWAAKSGYCSFQACAPTVAGDYIVQPTGEGIFALRRSDGESVFSSGGDVQHSRAAVIDGMLVTLLPQEGIAAYDIVAWKRKWEHKVADLYPNTKAENISLDASFAVDSQRKMVFTGTRTGYLLALKTSGERAWATNVGGTAISPSVDMASGLVFTGNWGKEVVALRCDSGEIVWRRPIDGFGYIPPTFSGGRLFLGTHVFNKEEEHGDLHCLNAADGKPIWTVRANWPAGPTVGETTMHRGNETSETFSSRNGLIGAPIVDGDVVVVQSKVGLMGFAIADGKCLWRVPLQRFGYTECAVKDGIIYAGSDRGEVAAVRTADGRRCWLYNLNGDETSVGAVKSDVSRAGEGVSKELGTMGSLTIDGDVLYGTASAGTTYALRLPRFQRRALLESSPKKAQP